MALVAWLAPVASALAQPSDSDLAFWSFRPVVRPEPPVVDSLPSDADPIDRFIQAKLAESGLTSAPPADRQTLVRRAYFDLLGLPPTPEQVAKFVDDPSPNAWPALIDELLASPHYGERWARHWLDVARYADTGGYETDIYYQNAWRYRDYVVKSFNDDKPYDVFVQEQIAGDEIWPDNLDLTGSYEMPPEKLRHLEARLGTGLYALGPLIHESNMDAALLSYERLTDWVDTTGSVFLGLTLGCARCHDHKFDPVTQADYYGLQAAFAGSKEVNVPIVHAMAIASYRQHYPRLIAIDEARRSYRLFEERLKANGGEPTPQDEDERGRLFGAIAQAVLALPESIPDAPGGPWDNLMEVPTATVLGHERPEFIQPVRILNRGDLDRAEDVAQPRLPLVLAKATNVEPDLPGPVGGRKELALWIARPENPLTARVMVNRIWLWHFGQGLVGTPNDFGAMGESPTHPELLDWLAAEIVSGGWRIKALHRRIMLTRTYQMTSRFGDEANRAADPENRLLWRFPRRRLEAEALWDAMHAAAGTLNLKLGGRPVIPPIAPEEIAAMRDPWQWVVAADPAEHNRRGLYILVRRNFRFPLFEIFDAPVNAVSCPERDVTTVAPQALWFLNNRSAFAQAQEFANRIVKETGDDPAAWADQAWRIALGRAPTADEAQDAVQLIESLAVEASETQPLENPPPELAALPPHRASAAVKFCLAVFNLNEFSYVD